MAEKYDPWPDLGKLIQAAIWGRHDAIRYGERIAHGIGVGEDDSAEAIAAVLKSAAGLRACRCAIDGGPGLVLPLACPVHGTPCEVCGGLEECKRNCGEACEATGTPSGTVCGVTPAGLYRAECGNGHPREGRLCARHAAAGLWCRDCFEADGTVRHVTPVPVPEAAARVTMPGQVAP